MSQGSSYSGFSRPSLVSKKSGEESVSSNSATITTSRAEKILGLQSPSASSRTPSSSNRSRVNHSTVNPFTRPVQTSRRSAGAAAAMKSMGFNSSEVSSEYNASEPKASSHRYTATASQIRRNAKKNRSIYPTGSNSSGISLPPQSQSSIPSFHPYLPTRSSVSSKKTETPQTSRIAAPSNKPMPPPSSHPSRSSQRQRESHQPNPFAESPHIGASRVALTEAMLRSKARLISNTSTVEPQQTRRNAQSIPSTVPLRRETTGLTPSLYSASTLPNSSASSAAGTSEFTPSVFNARTFSNQSFAHPGFRWSSPSNSKIIYNETSIMENISQMALYGDKMTSTYSFDLIGNLPCPDIKEPFNSDTFVSSFYDQTKEFIYNHENTSIQTLGEHWDKEKLFIFNILYRCKIDKIPNYLLKLLLQKANSERELQARNPVSVSNNLVYQIVRPRIGRSIAFIPFTRTQQNPDIVLKSLCIFVGLVAHMNEGILKDGTSRWYHFNININNIIWDEKNYLFRLYDFALSGPNFNYMKYYIYYNYIEKTMNGPPLSVGENYDIWLFRSPELNELFNVYFYIAQLIKENYNTSDDFNIYAIINSLNIQTYLNDFKTEYRKRLELEYKNLFLQHINPYVIEGTFFPNEEHIKQFIEHIKNAFYYYTKGSINNAIKELKFDEFIDMGKQDSWGVASSLSYLIQQNEILKTHPIGQQILIIMAKYVLDHAVPKERKNLNELYDIIKQDELIKTLWTEGTGLPDRGPQMYEKLFELVQTYRPTQNQ